MENINMKNHERIEELRKLKVEHTEIIEQND